jgi:DNA-binding CsgD family transcriptional regulator
LRRSRVSLEDLSSLVGRPVAEVAREVDRLAELRLVRVVDDTVYAEPPDLTLGRLVSEHEERVRAEEQALSRVRLSIPQYVLDHESRQVAWDPILIDAVETRDLVATMETLLDNSEGTLRFARPDQFNLAQGVQFDHLVLRALGAGRASRVIYPERIRDDLPELVVARGEAGEQVRLLPVVPLRLAIFGTGAAVIAEHFDRTEGRRLVIRQPAIVQLTIELFDQYWQRAVTVPGLGAVVGDGDRQLVEMLAAGAKDEQIARALGVSLRTVRRRVAALLADLGVRSRFQAGVEAMRRGWV